MDLKGRCEMARVEYERAKRANGNIDCSETRCILRHAHERLLEVENEISVRKAVGR